jgi:hypothetical protein
MCQKCLDAVRRWFPEIGENDIGELLWGATCFPFGGPEQVEEQLRKMHDKGLTTADEAMAYSDSEMERQMREAQAQGGTP